MSRGGVRAPYTGPRRTCLGCRVVLPAAVLHRVVLGPDGLLLDPGLGLPGRGAWVCSNPACAPRALRALGKALRVGHLAVEPEDFRRLLAGQALEVPAFVAHPDDDSGPTGGGFR